VVGFQAVSGAVATAWPTYTGSAAQNSGARDKFTGVHVPNFVIGRFTGATGKIKDEV